MKDQRITRRQQTRARRLARARALAAVAFIDESENAESPAEEWRLVDEAVRAALNVAAGLEKEAHECSA